MFTDSDGRYITAGQWHDEKFFTFTQPEFMQMQAPAYLLLGGMPEPVDEEKAIDGGKKTEVEVY